jgi:hypothetical protein
MIVRTGMKNSAYTPANPAPRPAAPDRPASASTPSVYTPTKSAPAPQAPSKKS